MNSVPAHERGQASGMRATFMNAGQVLSIGLFFSLMIFGLAQTLAAGDGRRTRPRKACPPRSRSRSSDAPPVSSLFAAFLGYNPMQQLVPATVLAALPPANAAEITGTKFFPELISAPFKDGLKITFTFSLIAYLIAAAASWLRGSRFVHGESGVDERYDKK